MGVRIRNVSRVREMKANLSALNRLAVEVGVFAGEGSAKNGADYAMIAAVHEFGCTIQQEKGAIHIPERSFLRSTFDEKQNDWFEFVKKRIPKLLEGNMGANQLMELLGAKMVADIQMKIRDLDSPPNAPSTIAQKGSSNPLIDTGGLRQRITYKVVSR